ncbi:hypothetical protein L227DRAFT_376408 [Lentinus tigrinus ALCF2SS1-6]|uniref:Uncharacterized protein n=1 Tax=Lentinus tigrinus ALCF2SS1-6 TaxID=1328759 RepID=A0A5C2RSM4_9APHY|nr:hypothetical protein L227DRAFT_376408 [Lentinus tigrinus ALCF2SS1-6]
MLVATSGVHLRVVVLVTVTVSVEVMIRGLPVMVLVSVTVVDARAVVVLVSVVVTVDVGVTVLVTVDVTVVVDAWRAARLWYSGSASASPVRSGWRRMILNAYKHPEPRRRLRGEHRRRWTTWRTSR